MGPRVWVVTGCSSGIGRATVELVLSATEDVVIATVRKPGALGELAAAHEGRLHEFLLEVTDSGGREALAAFVEERFGRVDVLVNNAGIATMGAALDLPEEELRRVFETNFFGAVWLSQWAGRMMVTHWRGTIIQISSTAGLIGFPANGAYSASKFALEGFSESLREETAGLGVRLHLLELGNCDTSFFGHNFRAVESTVPNAPVDQALEFFDSRRQSKESIGLSANDVSKAILAMVNSLDAPFRVMLGREATGAASTKIESLSADLERSGSFQPEPLSPFGNTMKP